MARTPILFSCFRCLGFARHDREGVSCGRCLGRLGMTMGLDMTVGGMTVEGAFVTGGIQKNGQTEPDLSVS